MYSRSLRGIRKLVGLVALWGIPCAAIEAQGANEAARTLLDARTRRAWMQMTAVADSVFIRLVRAEAERLIQGLELAERADVARSLDSAGAGAPLRMLQAAQELAGKGSLARLQFARVQSTGELRSLPDAELLARWFEARDPAYQMGLMFDGIITRVVTTTRPDLVGELDEWKRELSARAPPWQVVGEVSDGAGEMAHVVVRVLGDGAAGTLSFRRAGGRWVLAGVDTKEQFEQLARLELAYRQRHSSR